MNASLKLNEVDSEFSLTSFTLTESIGGNLPEILIEISTSNTDSYLDLTDLSGSILLDDIEIEFSGYVENKIIKNTMISFLIVTCEKSFYFENHVKTFSNIKSIAELYNSVTSSVQEQSITNEFEVFQNNITDYQLLLMYLKGYADDTVYALRYNDLVITSVTSKPTEELNASLFDRLLEVNNLSIKTDEMEPIYSEQNDNGLITRSFDKEFTIVNAEWKNLFDTINKNSKYYDKYTYKISIPYWLNISAGDLVSSKNNKFKTQNFIVTRSIKYTNIHESWQELCLLQLT